MHKAPLAQPIASPQQPPIVDSKEERRWEGPHSHDPLTHPSDDEKLPSDTHPDPAIIDSHPSHDPHADVDEQLWEAEEEGDGADAAAHPSSELSIHDPADDDAQAEAAAQQYREAQLQALTNDDADDGADIPRLERDRTEVAIDDGDDAAPQTAEQSGGAISIELPKELVMQGGKEEKAKKGQAKKLSQPRFTAQAKARLLLIRKVHLLTSVVLLQRWSALCDEQEVRAQILSLLPQRFYLTDEPPGTPRSSSSTSSSSPSSSPPSLSTFNLPYLTSLLSWYHNLFHLSTDTPALLTSLCSLGNIPLYLTCLTSQLSTSLLKRRGPAQAKLICFIALLRSLGLQVRYVHGMEVEGYQWSQEGWMDELRRKGTGVSVDVGGKALTMVINGQTVPVRDKRDNLRRMWKVVTASKAAGKGVGVGGVGGASQWTCDCGKGVETRNAELAALVIPPARSVSIMGRTISIERGQDRVEVLIDDDGDDDEGEKEVERLLAEAKRRKEGKGKEQRQRPEARQQQSQRSPQSSPSSQPQPQPPSSAPQRPGKQPRVAQRSLSTERQQPSRAKRRKMQPKKEEKMREEEVEDEDEEMKVEEAIAQDDDDEQEDTPLSKRRLPKDRAPKEGVRRSGRLIPPPASTKRTVAADDEVIVLSSDDDEVVAKIRAEEARREEERERLRAMEEDDDADDSPAAVPAAKQRRAGQGKDSEKDDGQRPRKRKPPTPTPVRRQLIASQPPATVDDDDDDQPTETPAALAMARLPLSSSSSPTPISQPKTQTKTESKAEPAEDEDDSDGCMVCGSHSSSKKNSVLLCDGCNRECHLKCTQPRLKAVPEDDWFCLRCITERQQQQQQQADSTGKTKREKVMAPSSSAVADENDDMEDEEWKGKKEKKQEQRMVEERKGEEEEKEEEEEKGQQGNVFAQFRFQASMDEAIASRGKEEKKAVDDAANDSDHSSVREFTPQKKTQQVARKSGKKTTLHRAATTSASSTPSSSSPPKRRRATSVSASSSSSPSPKGAKVKVDSSVLFIPFWCEVYVPAQERWVHIDPINCLIDQPHVYESIRPRRTFAYVLAAHSPTQLSRSPSSPAHALLLASSPFGLPIITDVTPRYSVGGLSINRPRLDEVYWDRIRTSLSAPLSPSDSRLADAELTSFHSARSQLHSEYPTSLAALKKHPLYTAGESLKKFEALRPGAKPVTRLRLGKQDVTLYLKSDVCELHTQDRWLREKRVVRDEELPRPAKLVLSHTMASRKKRKIRQWTSQPNGGAFDRLSLDQQSSLDSSSAPPTSSSLQAQTDDGDDLSTLYGVWQTDPWTPPDAVDGKVPKNARGQVDLWDPTHLPGGCVHLPYPRIASIARKLGVDHGEAMVGFDIKHGRSVPRFEGIVVHKDNAQWVLEAYQAREKEVREKAEAKRWERVSFNWRRLVRGMMVRNKIMQGLKDSVGGEGEMEGKGKGGKGGKGKRKGKEQQDQSGGGTKRGKKAEGSVPTGGEGTEVANDLEHVHDYTFSKSMNVDTGSWVATCRCGARSEYEEL